MASRDSSMLPNTLASASRLLGGTRSWPAAGEGGEGAPASVRDAMRSSDFERWAGGGATVLRLAHDLDLHGRADVTVEPQLHRVRPQLLDRLVERHLAP